MIICVSDRMDLVKMRPTFSERVLLHVVQKSRLISVPQNRRQHPGLSRTVLTALPLRSRSRTRALTVNQIQISLTSCSIPDLKNGTLMEKVIAQHFI